MKRRRRGDSEEESEELARARRERARRARADLARKAKGETGDDEAAKAQSDEKEKPEASTASDRAAARARLAKLRDTKRGNDEQDSKGKPEAKDSKRGLRSSKDAKGAEDSGSTKDEKPGKAAKPKLRRRGGEKSAGRGKDSKERKRGDEKSRKRSGAKSAGKGALVALKDGARETRTRAKKAAPKVGAALLGLIVSGFALFFTGFGFVLNFLIAVGHRVVPPVLTGLRLAQQVVRAVSAQVTPIRVLALVVAGAAVLLALSQYADYRNVTIGNDAYADGIQTVAPAPVRETAETGSAHSYLMVPLAALALVVLGASLTGRWRLTRLIAVAGLIAIAVGLIHDRPEGLDTGDLGQAYTGVKATLLGGFYAQLFSGLLLTLSSLLLGREMRLASARRPARASRGSRARRRLFRRNPRVEGARA